MLRSFFAATGLAVVGLLVAACGGGSSSKGESQTPVARAFAFTTAEDTPHQGRLDASGAGITAQIASPPSKGSVSISSSNPLSFTYTPDTDTSGPDSFTYTVSNGTSTSAPASVSVTITPVNDPPVANSDDARTIQGGSVLIAVLSNDIDADGDPLSVMITSAPTAGVATVDANQLVRFTPDPAFVGTTKLEYAISDSQGASATASVSVTVTLSSGVLFLAGPPQAENLMFTDGVRTLQVNAPLRAGERLGTFKAASAAPVVMYTTHMGTATHLYRADLTKPGNATEIEAPTDFPGITEYAVSADGSKLAYVYQYELKFADFPQQSVRELMSFSDLRNLFMNQDGTRLYYSGLILPPYLYSGALFEVDTTLAGPATPRQITPTVNTNSDTTGVEYLSRDGHRLYYQVHEGMTTRYMVVDPSVPSSAVELESSALSIQFDGVTFDEGALWGHVDHDYYLRRVHGPGSVTTVNLTAGTGIGMIVAADMTENGTALYYSRLSGGLAGVLYRVDTDSPGSSLPIASSTAHFGVQGMSLAAGGANLLYSTLDQVALGGGVLGSGSSDVYFMELAASPYTPRLVRHFGGAATPALHAPDGSFAIVIGSDEVNGTQYGYLVNLRNPDQITKISEAAVKEPALVRLP